MGLVTKFKLIQARFVNCTGRRSSDKFRGTPSNFYNFHKMSDQDRFGSSGQLAYFVHTYAMPIYANKY